MPITGLVDKVDIFQYIPISDGAGGLKQGSKSYVYKEISARLSKMDAASQLKEFGFAGKKAWKVVLPYSRDLKNTGDFFLSLSPTAPASVVEQGEIFRVIASRHQRNDTGQFHHTSAVVEKDEQAEAR